MTDLEYTDMQSIVTFQETLALKTEVLRNGLSHWWLDVHEGAGIQAGTRSEIQRALNDMRSWLDAIEGLVDDPPEVTLQDCPFCGGKHEPHLIAQCQLKP